MKAWIRKRYRAFVRWQQQNARKSAQRKLWRKERYTR